MTTPIDIPTLIDDMKNAATAVLDKDVATVKGFSQRQMEAIAGQAELVAAGIASGGITEETRDFLLQGLQEMTHNYVRALAGMELVTVERLWNAVIGVLWKAIGAATGIDFPVPDRPPKG